MSYFTNHRCIFERLSKRHKSLVNWGKKSQQIQQPYFQILNGKRHDDLYTTAVEVVSSKHVEDCSATCDKWNLCRSMTSNCHTFAKCTFGLLRKAAAIAAAFAAAVAFVTSLSKPTSSTSGSLENDVLHQASSQWHTQWLGSWSLMDRVVFRCHVQLVGMWL